MVPSFGDVLSSEMARRLMFGNLSSKLAIRRSAYTSGVDFGLYIVGLGITVAAIIFLHVHTNWDISIRLATFLYPIF